jgi:hypothetical protein
MRPASLAGPSGFSKLLSSLENNLESQKFLFFFLFHLKTGVHPVPNAQVCYFNNVWFMF